MTPDQRSDWLKPRLEVINNLICNKNAKIVKNIFHTQDILYSTFNIWKITLGPFYCGL